MEEEEEADASLASEPEPEAEEDVEAIERPLLLLLLRLRESYPLLLLPLLLLPLVLLQPPPTVPPPAVPSSPRSNRSLPSVVLVAPASVAASATERLRWRAAAAAAATAAAAFATTARPPVRPPPALRAEKLPRSRLRLLAAPRLRRPRLPLDRWEAPLRRDGAADAASPAALLLRLSECRRARCCCCSCRTGRRAALLRSPSRARCGDASAGEYLPGEPPPLRAEAWRASIAFARWAASPPGPLLPAPAEPRPAPSTPLAPAPAPEGPSAPRAPPGGAPALIGFSRPAAPAAPRDVVAAAAAASAACACALSTMASWNCSCSYVCGRKRSACVARFETSELGADGHDAGDALAVAPVQPCSAATSEARSRHASAPPTRLCTAFRATSRCPPGPNAATNVRGAGIGG